LSNAKDVIETVGVITEVHRGGIFIVVAEIGETSHTITARTSGKMKKFGIKLVVGDNVRIEISPYDLSKGRITYRT
jgi:translation initiation factor IF-1